MKAGDTNLTAWEAVAADNSIWRQTVKAGWQRGDQKRNERWGQRNKRRRQRATSARELSDKLNRQQLQKARPAVS